MSTSKLSDRESILCCLLKAAYSGAKLVIMDMTGWETSYVEELRLHRIIRRMQSDGTSFLLLCNTVNSCVELSNRVDLIRRGRITKSFYEGDYSGDELERLLLPYNVQRAALKHSEERVLPMGVFELLYSDSIKMEDYFAGLAFLPLRQTAMETDVVYLDSKALWLLCENMSIGDNLAMTCYPKMTYLPGVVSGAMLRFLEKNFGDLLTACGSTPKNSTGELSYAERKILVIEKWLLAGKKGIVLEDPLIGLDVSERLIMKKYLLQVSNRGIQITLLLHNSSGIEEICGSVYLCEQGRPIHHFSGSQTWEMEKTVFEWSRKEFIS